MNFSIEQVAWGSAGNALLAIRHAVFVIEQGVPAELEHDADDADALHLLVRDDSGTAIATARLLRNGHIGRMAVLPAWRGRGIGRALMQHLIRHAEHRGLEQLFLHAQCQAEPFYRRFGFVAQGDVFDEAGIAHQTMTRSLS